MQKYKLTGETKVWFDRTLYRMNKDMQRMSMPDKSYVDGIQSAYRALGFAAELRNLQSAVTRMANRCRYIAPGSRSMFLDKTYQ